jgi:DNA-binding NarL/FixJ family response regulator
MSEVGRDPSIAVIDAKEFRRAGISSLLEPWACSEKLKIVSITPNQAREELSGDSNHKMLIFSIGGELLAEPANLRELKVLCALSMAAPLVVISDRESLDDIALALSCGTQGYIYSGMKAALAFQVLSFILSGGSYFPPSVVRDLQCKSEQSPNPPKEPAVGNGPDSGGNGNGMYGVRLAGIPDDADCGSVALTFRQRQVLEHIRLGESNKLIGRQLGMTEGTVKVHVRQIMRKYGVFNRTQLAVGMVRNGESTSR